MLLICFPEQQPFLLALDSLVYNDPEDKHIFMNSTLTRGEKRNGWTLNIRFISVDISISAVGTACVKVLHNTNAKKTTIVETNCVISYLDRGIVNCFTLMKPASACASTLEDTCPRSNKFWFSVSLVFTWQMLLPWFWQLAGFARLRCSVAPLAEAAFSLAAALSRSLSGSRRHICVVCLAIILRCNRCTCYFSRS